jgi:L-ribulose-5-phosphate 3-epimerase
MHRSTRREFINRSVSLAGVGAVALATGRSPGVHAADAAANVKQVNRGRIFKTVKWNMISGKTVLDKFKLLKAAGFDGAELRSSGVNTKEALAASAETGLPIHGTVHGKTDGIEDAIGQCWRFGGNAILVTTNNHKKAVADIGKAMPTAAKYGVHVLIEPVWNGFGYNVGPKGACTPDPYIKILDEINSPWAGMYFDTGNIVKYGVAHQWVQLLGKRTIKLDIKDYRRKANQFGKPGFCKIGEGDVDWPKVRKALAENGFSGWATAERIGGGGLEQLTETAGRMDRVLAMGK